MKHLIKWTMSIDEYLYNFHGDFHKVHQGVWNLFGQQNSVRKFMYREEVKRNQVDILIRSDIDAQVYPDFGEIQNKMDPLAVKNASRYRLWATVNPIVAKVDEGKKNSAKVPLVKKDDIDNWFKARIEKNGAVVDKLVSSPPQKRFSKTKNFPLSTVSMQALVTITNEVEFKKLLAHGIGSARSYGCGLILALPASTSIESDLDSDDE